MENQISGGKQNSSQMQKKWRMKMETKREHMINMQETDAAQAYFVKNFEKIITKQVMN